MVLMVGRLLSHQELISRGKLKLYSILLEIQQTNRLYLFVSLYFKQDQKDQQDPQGQQVPQDHKDLKVRKVLPELKEIKEILVKG